MSVKPQKNQRQPLPKAQRKAGNKGKPKKRGFITPNVNRDSKVIQSSADKILKVAGGQGTDTRSASTQQPDAVKTSLLVPSQDPTLDILAVTDDRALQYLAMGTLLRAIKRGWLLQIDDSNAHPYYAFRYLLDAYRSAVKGTIPQLQQAPVYFWECCYALKPKTENFKTSKINYSCEILDNLDEVNPDVTYPLGVNDEDYSIFWGVNNGVGDVNGFYELSAPSSPYTEDFGARAIKNLWQCFPNEGMNKLISDPSGDAFMLHDTSAQTASYAEYAQSYGAPGGAALTLYHERFINCPILAKFVQYQEQEGGWRGWQELRKSAGSATYIAPRSTELKTPKQLTNKISPIFLIYNFDEYVEVGALWIGRVLETLKANSTTGSTIPEYPLTSLQFQTLLRQTIIPYFDNDMAQDIRVSFTGTGGALITMLPLTVGPNGASLTSASAGMKMPRFFVEMLRCARRLTSALKNRYDASDSHNVVDLLPVLCRPGSIPALNQYTWNNGGVDTEVFVVNPGEVAVDLVECSAMVNNLKVFLDLNGEELENLATSHNEWMSKVTQASTAHLDAGSVESGVAALNLNVITNQVQWLESIQQQQAVVPVVAQSNSSSKGPSQPRVIKQGPVAKHRIGTVDSRSILGKDPLSRAVLARKNSKKRSVGAKIDMKVAVGVQPVGESTYFQQNTGMVKLSSTFPIYAPMWKYQAQMVKPIFFYNYAQGQGTTQLYQSVQVQPVTLPLGSRQSFFQALDTSMWSPPLYDMHLNCANLDIKAVNSMSKTEMETDFDTMQQEGHGGFFTSLGAAIGGFVDSAFGG